MIQQLIDKLKRELYETEAAHGDLGLAYRDGWNARARSLIRELEEMLAEAQRREAVHS